MFYFQKATLLGGGNSPVKQFQNATQATPAPVEHLPGLKIYHQRLYVHLWKKTKLNLDGKQRVKSQSRHEKVVQILIEQYSNNTQQFHSIAIVDFLSKDLRAMCTRF